MGKGKQNPGKGLRDPSRAVPGAGVTQILGGAVILKFMFIMFQNDLKGLKEINKVKSNSKWMLRILDVGGPGSQKMEKNQGELCFSLGSYE